MEDKGGKEKSEVDEKESEVDEVEAKAGEVEGEVDEVEDEAGEEADEVSGKRWRQRGTGGSWNQRRRSQSSLFTKRRERTSMV